ncbi:inorganic pyrophosphatase [Bradyrhizobium sp. i1.4.4]
MTNLTKLPSWADNDNIFAVVETPRGSSCKLESSFDPKLGVFALAKPLMAGLTYPYDWGFIPSTKAEGGDPLDVLIRANLSRCCATLPADRHSRSRAEEKGQVRAKRPHFCSAGPVTARNEIKDIRNLPSHARDDLEQFFRATNALENKELKFLGWHGPNRATKTIKRLAR